MRVLWFCLAAFFFLYSVWFFYDGFVEWPRQNQRIAALEAVLRAPPWDDPGAVDRATAELQTLQKHTPMDLTIQKICGVIVGIIGVVFVALGVRARSRPEPAPFPQ